MLGVNQATLRVWADSGRLRTFRTPGGHRRFSREDIAALVERAPPRAPAQQANGWPEAALDRMRRRLRRRRGQGEDWYQHFDEEGKGRMRVLGRRLLALANDYVSQKRRRSDLLEEARFLGLEYARELAAGNVKLADAIAAFIYFRNALHDAIASALSPAGRAPGAPGPQSAGAGRSALWSDVLTLEDTVLLAIAEAYQKA
jgi:excisionase family DNA binding protein